MVAMAQPFISVNNNGGGAMEVAVELKGPNNLPVTAQLFLSQRLLTPGEQYWTCNACKCMDPYMCDMHRRHLMDFLTLFAMKCPDRASLDSHFT